MSLDFLQSWCRHAHGILSVCALPEINMLTCGEPRFSTIPMHPQDLETLLPREGDMQDSSQRDSRRLSCASKREMKSWISHKMTIQALLSSCLQSFTLPRALYHQICEICNKRAVGNEVQTACRSAGELEQAEVHSSLALCGAAVRLCIWVARCSRKRLIWQT